MRRGSDWREQALAVFADTTATSPADVTVGD